MYIILLFLVKVAKQQYMCDDRKGRDRQENRERERLSFLAKKSSNLIHSRNDQSGYSAIYVRYVRSSSIIEHCTCVVFSSSTSCRVYDKYNIKNIHIMKHKMKKKFKKRRIVWKQYGQPQIYFYSHFSPERLSVGGREKKYTQNCWRDGE